MTVILLRLIQFILFDLLNLLTAESPGSLQYLKKDYQVFDLPGFFPKRKLHYACLNISLSLFAAEVVTQGCSVQKLLLTVSQISEDASPFYLSRRLTFSGFINCSTGVFL